MEHVPEIAAVTTVSNSPTLAIKIGQNSDFQLGDGTPLAPRNILQNQPPAAWIRVANHLTASSRCRHADGLPSNHYATAPHSDYKDFLAPFVTRLAVAV